MTYENRISVYSSSCGDFAHWAMSIAWHFRIHPCVALTNAVTNLRTRFLRGTYSFDDLPQSYIAVPPLRQLPQLDPVESPIACSRESKRGKDQTHILISPSVLSRGIRPNPAARVPVFLRRFIQRSDVVQYPTVSRPWDQEDFSSARIKAGSCICTNHVGVCGDA